MSADYQTINHSERDITQQFDINEFNKNFEENDEDLNKELNKQKEIDDNKIKAILDIKPIEYDIKIGNMNDVKIFFKNINKTYNMYFVIAIGLFIIGIILISIGYRK